MPDRELIDSIIKALGSPEDVRRRNQQIDELFKEREQRAFLFRSLRTGATYAATVTAGILAAKALGLQIRDIFAWLVNGGGK